MADSFTIADTPATLPAGTPPERSAEGHRLAILRPAHRKQTEETVELIARVSRGLIKVRFAGTGRYCAVYSFRLIDKATRRKLLHNSHHSDFLDLPWQGEGPDPDRARVPDAGGAP